MKKRRIFIAIDMPSQIKKKILDFQKKWFDLPVRWTKEANLHLTLVFIGYVDDERMLEICRLTKEIVKRHNPFEISFKQICLGPNSKEHRMIWLKGEKSIDLIKLKNDLENTLFNSYKSRFNNLEIKVFSPHITLARIKRDEWMKLPNKPDIEREALFNVSVDSVKIMESHLSRGGAEYAILESIELGSL